MRVRELLAPIFLFALLSAGGRALALDLSWSAPPSCPDAATARGILEQELGARSDATLPRVVAEIVAEPDGYHMELTLERPERTTSERYFAVHCATFAQLIALQLAWAEERVDESAAPSSAFADLRYGLRALASVGGAPLPRWSLRGGVGGVLALAQARLELLLGYDLPRTVEEPSSAAVSARFDALSAQLRACWAPRVRRLELPLCAGVELGMVRGSASGVEHGRRVRRGSSALGLAPVLRFPAGGAFSGFAEVSAWLGLYRPTFAIQNLAARYRPELVSFRTVVGLELQFD